MYTYVKFVRRIKNLIYNVLENKQKIFYLVEKIFENLFKQFLKPEKKGIQLH